VSKFLWARFSRLAGSIKSRLRQERIKRDTSPARAAKADPERVGSLDGLNELAGRLNDFAFERG